MKKLLVIFVFLGILGSSFAYHYDSKKADNLESFILQVDLYNFTDYDLAQFTKILFKDIDLYLK